MTDEVTLASQSRVWLAPYPYFLPINQKGEDLIELALGYGGSVGALKSMGAMEMGLSEEELQPLVDSWRSANPNIVRFWWDVDRAVKKAVKQREPSVLKGICVHVHDELIIECGKDVSLDAVCEQMGRTPPWAEGLVLDADGFETVFYKKS